MDTVKDLDNYKGAVNGVETMQKCIWVDEVGGVSLRLEREESSSPPSSETNPRDRDARTTFYRVPSFDPIVTELIKEKERNLLCYNVTDTM